MHDTKVKMRDGRVFEGPIWVWRPKEGWFALGACEDCPERIFFREVESATTAGERAPIPMMRETGEVSYERDELARARADGWDGS